MKTASITLALILAALSVGCTTTKERSRNLADPSVSGKVLALQVCSNCHGIDGNSINPNFPRLSGQQEQYFIAQLKEFKSHDRLDPAGFEYMWGLSRQLTDQQIKDLAAYFAEQKSTPVVSTDAKLAGDGKQIFDKGVPTLNIPACATCHGAEGRGAGSFPRLANQHADYLVKQLKVFQRTDQRPEGSVMKLIAHSLTEQDMEAVASYLQAISTH